jgi:antitoxin VapB
MAKATTKAAKTTEKRAKLFRNGASQAVRLPKEFRFEGTEVRIRRVKDGVLLEPVGAQIGAGDWASVRKVLKSLGPLKPEFAEMMDEAMKKLQEADKGK